MRGTLSAGNDLLYKWTNMHAFFSFKSFFFITSGATLLSTAFTLLKTKILLSLFYVDQVDTCQSSIKQTSRLTKGLAQSTLSCTMLVHENHCHIFLRPNTRVKILFTLHLIYNFKGVWPKCQNNQSKIKS